MQVIEKAYGYITRMNDGKLQVLVFEHEDVEAGIQIPKGTVEEGETPLQAVEREMFEETGLTDLSVIKLIAQDYWEHYSGVIHKRYFYHLITNDLRNEWSHYPTGGVAEDGLCFRLFWIESEEDVSLVKGHGDYLYRIFSKVIS